ncbi:hypothetical protein WJX73_001273 [Symbiochloris irregularis]|uniref:Uncharacterized protein n=1 Tax=Symbiochloris irregularis TaxID=706552 RepID=A0AAW1PFL8_9CHLO
MSIRLLVVSLFFFRSFAMGQAQSCTTSTAPPVWSAEALREAEEALTNQLSVLFVLDPNFVLCWQQITVDAFTNSTLLPWLHGLRDELTVTDYSPGEGLKYDQAISPYNPVEPAVDGQASFRELVQQVWNDKNATIQLPTNLITVYQLSMAQIAVSTVLPGSQDRQKEQGSLTIPPSRIRVTTMRSFWQVVEQAAISRQLSTPPRWDAQPELVRSIKGSVVILPRLVTQLHNYMRVDAADESSRRILAMGTEHVLHLLQIFVDLAGVSTVPSLQEYPILPDKEQLQGFYQSYYDKDPAGRTPPIPTVFVRPPMSKPAQQVLCHSSLHIPAPALIDDIMFQIFSGTVELERSVKKGDALRDLDEVTVASQEGPHNKIMFHFALKRMFSESAVGVTFFKLPMEVITAAGEAPAEDCIFEGRPCWRAGPPIAIHDSEFELLPEENFTDRQLVMTQPYLQASAHKVANGSCGEAWMLQPKIKNMASLEYRVYLIGGASAQPGDEIVVYTPAVLGDEGGISMFNLTLPPGHFWSDVITPPSGPKLKETIESPPSPDAVYPEDRRPWPAPALYDQILKAGLDGARALAAHEHGKLQLASQAYIRIDVVLATWEKDGELQTLPIVSEMDWFNSAMAVYDGWKIALSHLEALRASRNVLKDGQDVCPTLNSSGNAMKAAGNNTVLVSQQPEPVGFGEMFAASAADSV